MVGLSTTEWLFVAVTVILLVLAAIFSAAEIGILSVNRFRLQQLAEHNAPGARTLQRLLQQPSRMLTAVLILITTFNYANESLVTYWLHGQRHLPEWIPFVSLLLVVLIFAEITPVTYAAANPESVGLRAAPTVALATRLMSPVVSAVAVVAHGIMRIFGGVPRPRPMITGEEVLAIVDLEAERGVLEEEEKELIHSIFEFSETIVREIMVPRIDIIAVSEDAPIRDALRLIIDRRFSRLPVYEDSLDHIIGLVHVKDLLPFQLRGETDLLVRDAMRPANFVPETKPVRELLREFRENKQSMSIVLDEYGGTAGMVTIEDLLEEIVGEIYDEYDVQQRSVEQLDANTWMVDGKFSIDELGDVLDHEFPEGEYDTVGGMLYSHFGDVPVRGEIADIEGFRFTIERLDGHRIAKVRVERMTADDETLER
jgi:CBS domain containing-hemolysin-like protein